MSRQGFQAQCQGCPTITGEDYGETIHNGVMSLNGSVQAQVEVMTWAKQHAIETTHDVKVTHYIHMEFNATEMDRKVWEAITGG